MASFEKFMKDLEERQRVREEQAQRLKKAHEEHHQRRRVRLYSERWSNSVRHTPVRKNK